MLGEHRCLEVMLHLLGEVNFRGTWCWGDISIKLNRSTLLSVLLLDVADAFFLRDGVDVFLHCVKFLLRDHDGVQFLVVEVPGVVLGGRYSVLSYCGVWSEFGSDIRILARLCG